LEPRTRDKPTGKEWYQGEPLEFNPTAGKELIDLSLLYSTNIRIPRVIDVKVIPEDQAISLHYSEHLGRYPLLQTWV
jgi:hypothetical protein